MANKRVGVTLDINADISQVRAAATQLQQLLSGSNLSSGVQKNINKMATGLTSALTELEAKASQPIKDGAGAKDLERAYKKVFDYFNRINLEVSNLSNLKGTDLEAIFPDVQKKIKDLDDYFKTFERVQKKIESSADLKNNKRALEKAEQSKAESEKRIETIKANGYSEQSVIDEATKSVKDLKGKWEELKTTHEKATEALKEYNNKLAESTKKSESAKEKRAYADELKKKYSIKEINGQLRADWRTKENRGKDEQGNSIAEQHTRDWQAAEQAAQAYETAAKAAAEAVPKLETDQAGIDKLAQDAEAARQAYVQAAEAKDKLISKKKYDSSIESETTNIERQEERIKDLTEKIKGYDDQLKTAFDNLKTDFQKLTGDESFKDLEYSEENLKKLSDAAAAFKTGEIEKAVKIFEELGITLDKAVPSTEKIRNGIDKVGDSLHQMSETEQEISHLTSRLKYFFSLAGGFQLMRRAIRSAVETTKELDAVMTQTAVVSDYSVGDMWKTLPQYSKYAKQLGAQIKDVYSAQTLYVQQGLDMNNAMDLGIETLKMARVAGIDAATATDTMTAALRGFKMELNETSAIRINDVYSKLAQNSASNVQEISTAMSKVAALANSANMSFENTAGFLAKIIESTREGAETAGTALKTVIARFTEVKKLYSEGELTGTDEEGQEVDVNKISAALRTAGINMNDFFTGAKGLDEIFMELGSKWDSLTTVQQRYIATMAAGSRQQSRFLALMQDYNRTVELTNMAYNSAGSGQEQFEKTLDSLESKLNQLKAAWDTFTMGIANSDFIKGIIDAGTKLLEAINKIIDAVSNGNGAIKSILSLGTAFTGFKLGGALLKGGLGKIGTIIGMRAGADAGKGFITTFMTSVKAAQYGTKLSTAGDLLGRSLTRQFAPTLKQATSYLYNDFWKTVNIQETFKGKGDLFKQFQEGFNTKDIDKMNKALKEAGSEAQITQDQMNALSAANKGLQLNFNAVANSALIFGGALVALGTYLESVGGHTGEVGTVVKKVGISLLACGAAFKVAAMAAQAFGTSLYEIPYIGWIAAAITVIVAAITAWAAATENATEKAERLKKAAEETAEGVKKVKSDYEDLMSKIDSINKAESGLDELTTGTEEWDTAVQNLNQSILELIKLYPGLAEAVTYTNGRLGLDMTSEAYKNYVKDYKARIANGIYGDFSGSLGVQYNDYEQAADKGGYSYLNGKETLGVLFNSNSLKEAAHFWAESLSDGLYGANVERMKTLVNGGYFDQMYDLLDLAVKSGYVTDTRIGVGWEEFDQWLVDSGLSKKYDNYFDKEITISYNYGPKENPGSTTETKTLWDFFGYNMFGPDSGIIYWEDYIKAMNAGLKYNEGVNTLSTFAATNVMETAGLSQSKYSSILYQLARQLYKNNYDVNSVDTSNLDLVKFADSIGGKYESGEVYTSQGTKVTENAKFWQAGKNAEAKAAVQLSHINSKIGSLNPNEASMLLGLVENRKNLTLQQITDLLNGNVSKIGDFSLKEIAEYAGIKETHDKTAEDLLLDDVRKIYNEAFSPLKGLKNNINIQKAIEGTGFQTISQASNIAQQATNVEMRGGNSFEFINKLSELEQQVEKKISPNKLEEAKNIIAATDFSNIESIKATISSLNELGANIDDNFTQSIISASNAVSNFSTKTLEEQLTNLEEGKTAAQKLEEGTYTLNAKEYEGLANILRSQNPEKWDSQWVRTGLDEWTYVGEETNSILTSIDAAVSTLVSESLKNAREDVEKGKEIGQKINNNKKLTAKYYDEDGEVFDTKEFDTAEFFENLYDSEFKADLPQLRAAAELLGVDISKFDTHNAEGLDLAQQAVFDYYDKYYGSNGGSLIANEEKIAGLETYTGILPYEYERAQSVLNNRDLTRQEQTEVLETGVKKLGAGEEYMAQQDIAALSKDGKDLSNVINALTIDSTKSAKRFDNLTQSYKDNADALKKENKGTREYGLALGNLTKSVKTAFGNNDKITEDFVDKHLDLFENYANGVEGAEDDIRKAMMDEGIIEGTTDQLNQLQATIDGIDGEQLSINGTADCSQAFSELAALYGSAEAAAAAMEALGYSVTWEPDGETTMVMPDGSTRSIPNYKAVVKDSAGNAVNRNKGGGGGGGGGGKKEFKNDFDKYYNMVEDINELERLRNLLESDYNQLLASRAKSGKDIYDNLKKQLKLLQEQYDLQADLAEKRKQQIVDTMNSDDYKDLQEYAWWNEEDQTLEIDWDKINNIKDSELGDRIKEYVSKMEGFQGQYDDAIEALEQIESTIEEIKQRGKEEYTSLEDRVRDALIKQIQDKIDDLTAVDQAISDANQRVLDSISETLEMQRQDRENAKTEESLADKEQRLAYLRQDSSNANAVEIARLEKELAEEREDYTDTLIDQKISELQKQNEKAAEQRQQQIDLMQESLDYQEKTGAFWDQVYEYINNGVDAIGNLIPGSDLVTLLSTAEGFAGLSEIGQMTWLEELEDTVAQAVGYLALSRQLEDIGVKEGTKITFTNAEGQTLTGKVDKNGNVVVDNGDGTKTTYKDVYQSYDGTYHTMESEKDAKTESKPATSTGGSGSSGGSSGGKTDSKPQTGTTSYNVESGSKSATVTEVKGSGGKYSKKSDAEQAAKNLNSWNIKQEGESWMAVPVGAGNGYLKPWAMARAKELNQHRILQYATGGIADYTGPAWLDGTPSKPELILSPQDTQNFIQLKDVLADIKKNGGMFNGNGGDNYYDIDVHVDQMNSDYDVDRAIDRIKTRLYQDGAYRNVNTLSRLR